MKSEILVYIIFAICIVYTLYVQIKLLIKSDMPRQIKIAQSIFIWLLPFIGAWVINWFLNYKEPTREELKELKKKSWNLNESGVAENV